MRQIRRAQHTLCEAVELAEEGAKHPALGEVINQVDPGTRRRHHDVGDSKVDNEVVGWRVHSLVPCNDKQYDHISNQRQHNDDAVHRRLQRDTAMRP